MVSYEAHTVMFTSLSDFHQTLHLGSQPQLFRHVCCFLACGLCPLLYLLLSPFPRTSLRCSPAISSSRSFQRASPPPPLGRCPAADTHLLLLNYTATCFPHAQRSSEDKSVSCPSLQPHPFQSSGAGRLLVPTLIETYPQSSLRATDEGNTSGEVRKLRPPLLQVESLPKLWPGLQ